MFTTHTTYRMMIPTAPTVAPAPRQAVAESGTARTGEVVRRKA